MQPRHFRIRLRSTITSARPRYASRKSLARRLAMSMKRSKARPVSSRPSTNGHSSLMPAWVLPARWSRSRTIRSRCGPVRKSRISPVTASPAFSACRRRKCAPIWVPGPGSYGRNDAGDAAMDAALLAKSVGKPVRLQYMRDQATGWDPKAPASIHRARAAIDAAGKVIAYEFTSKAFPRVDVNSNESKPHDTLAGQLTGVALQSGDGFGVPEDSYGFANKRTSWETIAPLLDRGSPLRTSHMRDPVGPQIHFASESFMDEVATALKLDPVAFRLQYVTDPRDIAVIKAAAEKAGWQSRPSPRKDQS